MKSKKLVAMLLALCMIFALAACSPKDDGGNSGGGGGDVVADDGQVVGEVGETGNTMFNKPGADVVLDHDEPDGGMYIQTTPKK